MSHKLSLAELENITLAVPPLGSFVHDSERDFNGHEVLIVGTIGIFLAVVALLGRIYAKAYLFRKVTADDYLYILSWPFGVALICLQIAIIMGGAFGHHSWDVRIKEVTRPVLVRALILETTMGPFLWISKLPIFSLILTAFAPLRYTKPIAFTSIMISGILYCGTAIALGVACAPRGGTSREAYFAGMLGETCSTTTGIVPRMSILQGTTSVATDLVLCFLPLPSLWQLCLPFKQKVGIFIILFAAFGACISSIASLIFRAKIYGGADNLFYQTPLFVTGIVEIIVGLLVPCTISFMRIYRSWQASPPLVILSTNQSSRTRNRSKTKRRVTGRDELVLYSTTVSSRWKELGSGSIQEDVGSEPKELNPIHIVRTFDVESVRVTSIEV